MNEIIFINFCLLSYNNLDKVKVVLSGTEENKWPFESLSYEKELDVQSLLHLLVK